jgi:ribosomal protein S18 acetylase RimI-like enzyme
MHHPVEDGAVTAAAMTFWAADLNTPADRLFAEPWQLLDHGEAHPGFDGAFALARDGAITIGAPTARRAVVGDLLRKAGRPDTLEAIAAALSPLATSVNGPAWIGYAHHRFPAGGIARALGPDDAAARAALKQACSVEEWRHGGSDHGDPAAGVFLADRLVAVAGYTVWGGTIAHIAIATDPHYRGQGHGRAAVAALAAQAQQRGLIPQYRCLEGNLGSMRIASALGFRLFARSIAVRFTG